MNLIYQSAFLEALGWSLLDSLWKMGALWVLYILLTGNGKRFSASKRYSIAVLAMGSGSIWFIAGLITNYLHLFHGKEAHTITFYLRSELGFSLPRLGSAVPFLSILYVIAVVIFATRLLHQYWKNKIMVGAAFVHTDDSIKRLFEELIIRIGITRRVQLWLSGHINTPFTIGFLKPIILLPVAILNQLTLEQAEAVIAHELFHIRRNDYLVNLLLAFAEVMLFFNPFARILQDVIRKERENCCDDEVLGLGCDKWQYAQALCILGRYNSTPSVVALAITGSSKKLLLQRIKRMAKGQRSFAPVIKPLSIFFLTALLGLSTGKPGKKVISAKKTTLAVFNPSDSQTMTSSSLMREKVIDLAAEVHDDPFRTPTSGSEKLSRQVQVLAPVVITQPKKPKAPSLPPVPSPSEDPEVSGKAMVTTFVSMHSTPLEFSFILHTPPAPTPLSDQGKILPYVPASTFYYSDIDSASSAKKVIRL